MASAASGETVASSPSEMESSWGRAQSIGASSTPASRAMRARMRTPRFSSSWSASAPAKHSGAVRRPEYCPPPRMSLAPENFTEAG